MQAAVLVLVTAPVLAALHIFKDHGYSEESRLQVWLHAFYAKIEPGVVWLIDKLLKNRFLSGTRVGRAILTAIGKALWFLPHGVVVDHEAALRLIDEIPEDSHIAIGPCVCKKGIGARVEPYYTDMVIMYGARAYKLAHPEEYRFITKEEAKRLLKEFREHNLVHEVFACFKAKSWAFVICNCDARYCIPTRSYILTKEGVYPGPLVARVKEDLCRGVDNCGVCAKICPFGAVTSLDGKSSVDAGKCMGCGLCVYRCPQGARELVPRENYNPRFLPIEHTHPWLVSR
uniref:4Fe-4S dicluster domain-containing protein n=1 Tax=Thermofilum pendens TaxID=2269 RepID=A0A7J3X6T7_THEPE